MIKATMRDKGYGYDFQITYQSRRSFLAAITKQTRSIFIKAIDFDTNITITPSNLNDYRNNSL